MICNSLKKEPLPKKLPIGMQKIIVQLKKCKTKQEILKKAYTLLCKRFRGERLKTYLLFFRAWRRDVNKIWGSQGFLHCTHLNFLLRILLIKSGRFTEKDIRQRWTVMWGISPHQYLLVNTEKGWVEVDLWGHNNNVPFGSHAGI